MYPDSIRIQNASVYPAKERMTMFLQSMTSA